MPKMTKTQVDRTLNRMIGSCSKLALSSAGFGKPMRFTTAQQKKLMDIQDKLQSLRKAVK
jgi:hypothetical protein